MKIWIDKHGGMHYHKEYAEITVEGRRYRPCPFCFGYDRRFI